MKMTSRCRKTLKLIFLSFICLFITACNEDIYPIEVSEGFWRAMKNKDAKAIQKYSTNNNLKENEISENILPLDEITLGKTVIDGDSAWVDTTVTISGDKPFTIPLRTKLIRENNQWKVDYDTTIKLVSKGSSISSVINSIRNMSKDLVEKLNQSMEESLLEHLPELKKQIEEFVRELKDAIEGLGKESDESTPIET